LVRCCVFVKCWARFAALLAAMRKEKVLDIIHDGEKYAMIAFQTHSSVDMPPTEMLPGIWVSSAPMISMGAHWKEWLGSIRIGEIRDCNLFILAKTKAVAPPPINPFAYDKEYQALGKRIWQYYCGLMLADRFGVYRAPVLLSGIRADSEISVQQAQDLNAPIHADPRHQLDVSSVREGVSIGQSIENFPWGNTWRFNRTMHLYIEAREIVDWLDRLHQYARCLEGLTVPPIRGGTGNNFSSRIALFVGSGHENIFKEIYEIRGKIEHLHENKYLEVFDRKMRLELVKKVGIVEYVARTCIVRVLKNPALHPHFSTTAALEAFWQMSLTDRQTLWGGVVDPMDGIAGIKDDDFTDSDLSNS
jgi:hypothetical protein